MGKGFGLFFFLKKKYKYLKFKEKCSISLAIKEIKIEATMKYHLTLLSIVVMKKINQYKGLGGCGEKRTLMLHYGE